MEVERRKNRSKSIDAIRHTKHIVDAKKKKKINCWTRCDQNEVKEVEEKAKASLLWLHQSKHIIVLFNGRMMYSERVWMDGWIECKRTDVPLI